MMGDLPHHTYTPWRRFFAFLPVITGSEDSQRIVWLRHAEYRTSTLTYYGESWTDWEYREIPQAEVSHG